MAGKTLFVRTVTPHHHFAKEIAYPNGGLETVSVTGFDELGRPVMPVHEVPQCEEILSAIFKETIFEIDSKGEKIQKSAGRLVQVDDSLLDEFPRYIGAPKRGDSVETILAKTLAIRVEQKKGDVLLRLDEPSQPYVPPINLLLDTNVEDLEKRVEAIRKFEEMLTGSTPTEANADSD